MKCIVAKFGGWANADSERVKMAGDLFAAQDGRKVKVNSAIGKVEGLPKVTDLLVQGSEETLKSGSFPADVFEKINPYGMWILLILMFTGILGTIIALPVNFFLNIFDGIARFFLY